MKIKIGQEVRIKWVDAKMWGAGWLNLEDLSQFKLPICISRGKLVKKDNEMLLLNQNETDDGAIGNLIGIPKGCIKEIEELE